MHFHKVFPNFQIKSPLSEYDVTTVNHKVKNFGNYRECIWAYTNLYTKIY